MFLVNIGDVSQDQVKKCIGLNSTTNQTIVGKSDNLVISNEDNDLRVKSIVSYIIKKNYHIIFLQVVSKKL